MNTNNNDDDNSNDNNSDDHNNTNHTILNWDGPTLWQPHIVNGYVHTRHRPEYAMFDKHE